MAVTFVIPLMFSVFFCSLIAMIYVTSVMFYWSCKGKKVIRLPFKLVLGIVWCTFPTWIGYMLGLAAREENVCQVANFTVTLFAVYRNVLTILLTIIIVKIFTGLGKIREDFFFRNGGVLSLLGFIFSVAFGLVMGLVNGVHINEEKGCIDNDPGRLIRAIFTLSCVIIGFIMTVYCLCIRIKSFSRKAQTTAVKNARKKSYQNMIWILLSIGVMRLFVNGMAIAGFDFGRPGNNVYEKIISGLIVFCLASQDGIAVVLLAYFTGYIKIVGKHIILCEPPPTSQESDSTSSTTRSSAHSNETPRTGHRKDVEIEMDD